MRVVFALLGELRMSVDGNSVVLAPGKQSGVLAALLVDAGRVVTADQLAWRVWGDEVPNRAAVTLRAHLSRLRRVLEPAGVRIDHTSAGYVLRPGSAVIDIDEFRDLVERGRYAAAFELWRGEPLAGLPGEWAETTRARWRAEEFAARLDHFDAEIALGAHASLIAPLTAAAAEHPLDERLAVQLLLVLHRSGRQAEALSRYEQLRVRLADELGVDPGPELRDLHLRMLNGGIGKQTRPVPRQLPVPPQHFTGREDELAALDNALGSTAVLHAVNGAGGTGKTSLALHWAHQRLDRFPDGQLFANLRGYDPSGEPTPPAVTIRGFLDALGVESASMPVDLDARIGLYRTLIADKRALIVLDNAHDAGQVVPLLPGGDTCTVLVTSRNRLADLTTTHGARPLTLDVLDARESTEMLTNRLGHERTGAEPGAVAVLVEVCAGLPLALSIVAARAVTQPQLPLAALAEELHDAAARLDGLDAGGMTANLRAVFSWSHEVLSPGGATMFGLLGSACGADISLPAAAALAGLPVNDARKVLRHLEDVHLVTQHAPGRYRMHDLIRLYAAENAAAEPEALARLVDFYLDTAHAADRLLYPHRHQYGEPPRRALALTDRAQALSWLTAENQNLVAAHRAAVAAGWDERAGLLTHALLLFRQHAGHFHDNLVGQRALFDTARRNGDGVAKAHKNMANAYVLVGQHADAIAHAEQAIEQSAQLGEHHLHLAALHVLAGAWEKQGEYREALKHTTAALEFGRNVDFPVMNIALRHLASYCHARLGEHTRARELSEQALALSRAHDYPNGEAEALAMLADVDITTGRYEDAVARLLRSIELAESLGGSYWIGNKLEELGKVYVALGRTAEARAVWQRTRDLYLAQSRFDKADEVRELLAALG